MNESRPLRDNYELLPPCKDCRHAERFLSLMVLPGANCNAPHLFQLDLVSGKRVRISEGNSQCWLQRHLEPRCGRPGRWFEEDESLEHGVLYRMLKHILRRLEK
jgi:hypothetical protein